MARHEPDWKAALGTAAGHRGTRRLPANGRGPQPARGLPAQTRRLRGQPRQQRRVPRRHTRTHALAGDIRFMRAENLFLLNRLDEAAKAYGEFIAAHEGPPERARRELPPRADPPRPGPAGRSASPSPHRCSRSKPEGPPLRAVAVHRRRLPVPAGEMGGGDRGAGGIPRHPRDRRRPGRAPWSRPIRTSTPR